MVYIPKDVPRKREELLGYIALLKASPSEQRQTEVLESTKAHYEEATTKLHYTPEIQLLELLQEALMDNSTQLEILKSFYTLSLYLLSSSNVQAPAELKAELGLHRSSQAEALPGMEKRSKREQRPRHAWSKVLVLETCLW